MSDKSKSTTFLLCYFLGGLGVHRFYLGKLITGVLMLITGGGFAIWWLIDLYRIITGGLKDKQGDELSVSQPYVDQPNAGFWVRLSAQMVDGLILGLIQFAFIFLPMIAYLYNTGMSMMLDPQMAAMSVPPILTLIPAAIVILYVLYFVALTAGKHQGTYGKRSMGIYVRKRDGGRVWIGHSLVRYVGYFVSMIPFGIGYLMAAFHNKKLALHDLIAGTEVVYGTPLGETITEAIAVDREEVTDSAQLEPDLMPIGMDEVRPSRVPEIMVGSGLLLIVGSMALAYIG